MSITKSGHTITSLEEWYQHARPKNQNQWKDGRSAKEAAQSWLSVVSPRLPAELESLLSGHSDFGAVLHWSAEPEVTLRFDTFAGGTRHTDLLVKARDRHGDYLIAVEAKADETFSTNLEKRMAAAIKQKQNRPRSKCVDRIEQLAAALLGTSSMTEPRFSALRYQLLTATAGALKAGIDAGADRVLFLVQEFVTSETTDKKHALNAQDLDRFIGCLSQNTFLQCASGQVYGPLLVPGIPLFNQQPALYIGKVTHHLRPPASLKAAKATRKARSKA